MGIGDSFTLWRALFAEPNAENDKHRRREKLALPILEGFEPEPWIDNILQRGHGLRGVGSGLLVRFANAVRPMQQEAGEKTQGQGEAQGVAVKLEE
jgi:hypothetical protein